MAAISTFLLWELRIAGRTIRTTAEHPFFRNGVWTEANRLSEVDRLLLEDGSTAAVESIRDTGEWSRVHNVRIADHHTYLVGSQDWGWSVRAHNYNVTPSVNGRPVTREQRWLDLANQPGSKLPKEVVDHIQRTGGAGVRDRFGLELAHLPKQAAAQGHDYSKALPKYVADHRGIQHQYLRERAIGTRIGIPRSGTVGRGPLSLPPKGALP